MRSIQKMMGLPFHAPQIYNIVKYRRYREVRNSVLELYGGVSSRKLDAAHSVMCSSLNCSSREANSSPSQLPCPSNIQ
jgi:hypothetical protein